MDSTVTIGKDGIATLVGLDQVAKMPQAPDTTKFAAGLHNTMDQ